MSGTLGLKTVVVTGCAGFIGSNLVDTLLKDGLKVIGIDNLSTGRMQFLENALTTDNFTFHKFDLLFGKNLQQLFENADMIFHLAANADVRFGTDHPKRDLEQNTIVTHNVLEAMRIAGVDQIVFSSTGSIYGEARVIPTPEDSPFPVQTSLYGASKLACEGLISAYCESFGMKSWIFRFVSILGPRYTHGHVFDFYQKLMDKSNELIVLGNGLQTKSYLHVEDCINGIKIGIQKSNQKINIFNLGTDDTCTIRDSITWITQTLNLNPSLNFGNELRGWIGDNPHIHLDVDKITKLDWKPKYSIKESVIDTVKYLSANMWLIDSDFGAK